MQKYRTSALGKTQKIRSGLLLAAGLTVVVNVSAEIESELPALIVSATKFPELASEITAEVDVLDLEGLERRGITNIRSALNDAPGVLSLSTAGETGALGALLIRGTSSSDSQVVVDGIRINDSNGDLSNNFLRGPRLNSFGRVELLKGPQASLYGGNALGGILFLETPETGSGAPETTIFAEAGDFDTLNTSISNSGSLGDFSWFVGGGYNETDNDAADQGFDQWNANLRFEWSPSEDLVLGTTLRLIDQRFDDSLTTTNHLDSILGTIYLRANFTENWKSSFVVGHYRQNFDLDFDGGLFHTDIDRTSFTTDHVITLNEEHTLRAGAYVENNDFESFGSSSFGPFSVSDDDELRYGGYVGWDWKILANLITKATVRWEDYADFGQEVTWNFGAAYEPIGGTRITGNIGRAFTPPTFLDLFGATETGSVGNPDLDAQESIGWDVGVEQVFLENHKFSITYFQNDIENAIDRTPTFSGLPAQNVGGDSLTNGVEIGLNGSFAKEIVTYRAAWTHLNKSLNAQPQNFANATVEVQATDKLVVGGGVNYLDDRSFGGVAVQSTIIGRVYARYALTDAISIHARVENVTDDEHELFNSGFGTTEGPGSAFFTGITARF